MIFVCFTEQRKHSSRHAKGFLWRIIVMLIIWLFLILWDILSLQVLNARQSLSTSQDSFVKTCDHFSAHANAISNVCVATFTGFTHSAKMFSCFKKKVTDVSHFSAQCKCSICAATVAYMEAGQCCLPKQRQLQVKSQPFILHLHGSAASNMLTFSVFSIPFYPDWILGNDFEHLKNAT